MVKLGYKSLLMLLFPLELLILLALPWPGAAPPPPAVALTLPPFTAPTTPEVEFTSNCGAGVEGKELRFGVPPVDIASPLNGIGGLDEGGNV